MKMYQNILLQTQYDICISANVRQSAVIWWLSWSSRNKIYNLTVGRLFCSDINVYIYIYVFAKCDWKYVLCDWTGTCFAYGLFVNSRNHVICGSYFHQNCPISWFVFTCFDSRVVVAQAKLWPDRILVLTKATNRLQYLEYEARKRLRKGFQHVYYSIFSYTWLHFGYGQYLRIYRV